MDYKAAAEDVLRICKLHQCSDVARYEIEQFGRHCAAEALREHLSALDKMLKNQTDIDDSDAWDHGHFCAVNDICKMTAAKVAEIEGKP